MRQGRVLLRAGGAALLVLGVCGCALIEPVLGKAFVVKDGQPHAEIVIVERPARMAKLAADELQEYVLKISGAKLPITTRPSEGCPVQIYVGRSAHTDRLKLSDKGLKHGAFRMASGQSWLALLGRDSDFTPPKPYNTSYGDRPRMMREWDARTGEKWGNPHATLYKRFNRELKIWDLDERGSLNAVYAFLRSLGVRWYLPGELGEVVPKRKTIALPRTNKVVRPDFPLRHIGPYTPIFVMDPKDAILWRLRLGLDAGRDLVGLGPMGHGTILAHGRDEVRKAHPEYFALLAGKRDTDHRNHGKPCLSSEGLLRANVRLARAVFDIYDEPMISVMPSDGYVNLCQCELCKGKGTPERGFEGQISDYVWDYVNRVAKELYKTHPDRKVICFAYGAYLLPPEKIDKLSPNVAVGICQWRSAFRKPETRKRYADIRKGWLKKLTSGDLIIWDYYLHSRPGRAYEGMPALFPHVIAQDLRSLKGISKGDFIEVTRSQPDGWHAIGITHLNVYVTARLYWDADRDIDAMLAEYYRTFYGPAAAEMKAFVDFAEANWMSLKSSVKDIDKTFALLAAARRAAGDTLYGKRIDLIIADVQPLKQLRERLTKGRQGVPEARALTRRKADIRLDGRLDDKFWEGLPVYHLRDLKTGKRPACRTSFRMGWAGNALYFGIRCEDPDTKHLNIPTTENGDANVWLGDSIELLLETQTHSYYQIATNPAGALVDADRRERIDTRWASGVQVAAHIGDDAWCLEVRVPAAGDNARDVDPLHGIAGRRPSTTYPWHFNVCRQRMRDKDRQLSAFSPTGKDHFHDLMKFAELIVR